SMPRATLIAAKTACVRARKLPIASWLPWPAMPQDSRRLRGRCSLETRRVLKPRARRGRRQSATMRGGSLPMRSRVGPRAPSDETCVAQATLGLAVTELAAVGGDHRAACREQHGMAGGGVPFHGRAEARIDIGIAARDLQELQRGARTRLAGNL